MIVLLRCIGILNSAVWFGAVIFFTLGVAPAFSSLEMKALLGEANYPAFSGRLAMVLISRYFVLQYWCAAIALLHQLSGRFYLGKPLQRINFGLLIGVCVLTLLGGAWLQPSLRRLHAIQYGRGDFYQPAQKAQAAKVFALREGLSSVLNVLVLGGLAAYLWRMANPEDSLRFIPAGKFRS